MTMIKFGLKTDSPGDSGGFYPVRPFWRLTRIFCIGILLCAMAISYAQAEPFELVETMDYGDGLVYSAYKHESVGTFYFVKLKASSEKWRLVPVSNRNGIRKCGNVKQLALDFDNEARIAVNASFFDTAKYPIGTVASGGVIMSLDNRKRTSLGIKTNGNGIMDIISPRAFITADDYFEPIWIWGYNQPSKKNAIICYNQNNGSSLINLPSDAKALVVKSEKVIDIVEKGKATIPDNGMVLLFRGKSLSHLDRFTTGCGVLLGLVMPKEWENTTSIITGGPRIIIDARLVDLKKNHENFESGLFKSHIRTIVGLTWNDEFFIAVFPKSVTYESASKALLAMNVKDAMGLDGGSSTSLWVRGVKYFNGSKSVPVALAVVPRNAESNPLPWFENKYWK